MIFQPQVAEQVELVQQTLEVAEAVVDRTLLLEEPEVQE
jgi:hypothetical protein